MNQQVKAIMIRHGLHKHITEDCQSRMEMLAELIVRECMNAVMDGTAEGDLYVMRIDNHFFDNGTGGILHFGVEE